VYEHPVDMRKSFDGLHAIASQVSNRPLNDAIAPRDRTSGAGERRAPSTESA
jgi:hypothetical protein